MLSSEPCSWVLHYTEPYRAVKHHMRAYEANTSAPWSTGRNHKQELRELHMQTCTWSCEADRWGNAAYPIVGLPLSDACKIKNISDLAQNMILLKTQVRTAHTFSNISHMNPTCHQATTSQPATLVAGCGSLLYTSMRQLS